MKISAIVAMAQNRVIGRGNDLPWKLPEDLKRFRQITLGHPIIMGRKTFESIGRVLPGRKNIVISRRPHFEVPGAAVVSSLEDALTAAGGAEEVFIIGGCEIYRLALEQVQTLYLTLVRHEVEGDVFFPEFNESSFNEVEREDREGPLPYSFITLERKRL
jgi:dihydrofolate reductase